MAYLTPGVYVEEVAKLPPSVAPVATAIPAFVGTTAKGKASTIEIEQVSSLLEYEERFGRAGPTAFTAQLDDSIGAASLDARNMLWYAINLYFLNGGGRCYVVSVDNEAAEIDAGRLGLGIDALKVEDEPTLIVVPQATALRQVDSDTLNQKVLGHCASLGDRFGLLDVKDGDVDAFRNGVQMDHLSYGAAYHPYLSTSLAHVFDDASVTVKMPQGAADAKLADLKTTNTQRYNSIRKNLAAQRVTLPPSAAMAGIYARVDRERGVWKAPANVGVLSVVGPSVQISVDQQDSLNVDATGGKSINAIRAFPGRGTLVWGARTLAGNDNEWRYVPVRRLFIMIEEAARKASAFAVFEPNDASTWLKVKGMLESYLFGLWENGALQGSKPEQAYYVSVGLGKTMTAQNVLEGLMIVEIGIAAVRPAEFIVLRFSHKLAEA